MRRLAMGWWISALVMGASATLIGCDDGTSNEADAAVDSGTSDTEGGADVSDGSAGDATDTGATDTGATDTGATDTGSTDTTDNDVQSGEICNNGIDDDSDTLTDCDDSECATAPECQPKVEDCENGVDDTGNNLIDCADPQCLAHAACAPDPEDCENGVDDNGNGDIDCADALCATHEACTAPCNTYFGCLVEEGCFCTVGINCPASGSDQYGQCLSNCLQSPQCNQMCLDGLSESDAAYASDYVQCLSTECGNQTPNSCVFSLNEQCLDEWAVCFQEGEGNCAEFNACANACPAEPPATNQECALACQNATSPAGVIDAVKHGNCVIANCNVDNNDKFDSPQCQTLAFYGLCGADWGSCYDPAWGTEGGLTCGGLLECWAGCEAFGNTTCAADCVAATDAEQLVFAEVTVQCLFEECGTFEDTLTPECIATALAGTCAPQEAECALSPPPAEICDNETDDDGDEAVDCEDSDCTEDPACIEK